MHLLAFTSVFQVFTIATGGIYIPLALLVAYACVPQIQWGEAIKYPIVVLIGAFLSSQVLSLVWSPDVVLGVREIGYSLIYLIVLCWGLGKMASQPEEVFHGLRLCCHLGLVQSVLVICFRLLPAIEDRFLASPMAKLFINPNNIESLLSGESLNNCLAPDKAGGFFVNANVAGVWSLVMGFSILATSREKPLIPTIIAAAIHFLAVIGCGSKASLLLLFSAPIVSVFLCGDRKISLSPSLKAVLFIFISLGIAATIPIISEVLPKSEFQEESVRTTESRAYIWTEAWSKFYDSPIVGQGYGGWQRSSTLSSAANSYGITDKFPLHNSLLIAWSQSGILAMLLSVIIYLWSFSTILGNSATDNHELAVWGTAAYGSFVVQSMGENYGVLGDPHLSVPIALLVAAATGTHATARMEIE